MENAVSSLLKFVTECELNNDIRGTERAKFMFWFVFKLLFNVIFI